MQRASAWAVVVGVTVVMAGAGCLRSSSPPAPVASGQQTPFAVAGWPPGSSTVSAASSASVAPGVASAEPAPVVVPPPEEPTETVEQLRERARRELGEKVSFALVHERFLMVGSPGWGASGVQSSAAFSERVLGALLTGRFDRLPTHTLPVYLFGDVSSYEAYCKKQYGGACISPYGFFSPSDRRLVMNVGLGIGSLSHELVHPIVEVDFPEAPTWLNEGIASLFEAPLMPKKGEIHGAKNWRYPRLQAALLSPRERDKVTLDALFALSDEQFRGDDESLNYALARYVCQWLDGRQQLWTFYRGWRDGVATDRFGKKAFQAATGQTTTEANDAWSRWARQL